MKHRSNGHDMNVERVWEQNIIGRGAVISILDDGIEYTHPDFEENYVCSREFLFRIFAMPCILHAGFSC